MDKSAQDDYQGYKDYKQRAKNFRGQVSLVGLMAAVPIAYGIGSGAYGIIIISAVIGAPIAAMYAQSANNAEDRALS